MRRRGRIANGMRSGRTTPQDSAISSPTPAPTPPEWPSQEEPGSGSIASALVSDVSAPACTNGVWPPLRPVSVAQENKPLTMLSYNVHSIYLPMDCMAWRFWTIRQTNDCSTPAPRSGAAKQWFQQLAQKKKTIRNTVSLSFSLHLCLIKEWKQICSYHFKSKKWKRIARVSSYLDDVELRGCVEFPNNWGIFLRCWGEQHQLIGLLVHFFPMSRQCYNGKWSEHHKSVGRFNRFTT